MPPASVVSAGFNPDTHAGPGAAKWRAFFQLTKPRVMALCLFTGFAGAVAAPGPAFALPVVLCLFFMALGAGAAGALNMWYERELDGKMARTAARPLPAGRLSPHAALLFAITLALVSLAGMALFVNPVAASLLALTIGFYLFIYTIWLKPRTPQNIVIGGAAGALPPVIGWAALSSPLAFEPFYLFLIIFLWTPPHFWALALYRTGDYDKAGLPMMPNLVGAPATCRQILLYTALLLPVALLPALHGTRGWLYGTAALALSLEFLRRAFNLYHMRHRPGLREKAARALFGFSILYLFLLFTALLAEEAVRVLTGSLNHV